jgi:hypothetical protein
VGGAGAAACGAWLFELHAARLNASASNRERQARAGLGISMPPDHIGSDLSALYLSTPPVILLDSL